MSWSNHRKRERREGRAKKRQRGGAAPPSSRPSFFLSLPSPSTPTSMKIEKLYIHSSRKRDSQTHLLESWSNDRAVKSWSRRHRPELLLSRGVEERTRSLELAKSGEMDVGHLENEGGRGRTQERGEMGRGSRLAEGRESERERRKERAFLRFRMKLLVIRPPPLRSIPGSVL